MLECVPSMPVLYKLPAPLCEPPVIIFARGKSPQFKGYHVHIRIVVLSTLALSVPDSGCPLLTSFGIVTAL